MAIEQTAYAGDDIKILVNVIGPSGTHVAAVINTTTTRLDGLSAAPTVTTVATGIYQIVFSGVTPTPAEGDRYTCKVNGTIAGVAWSEYGVAVKIQADERGTDGVSGGLDAAGVRTALGLSSANMDTQLSDLPTTSEFNARTLASADYFDSANDTVITDTASRNASKADVSSVSSDVTAIKAKTDQFTFTVANQVDANSLTGGGGDDAATIYTYFTASSRQDTFKATGFATVNPDNASITSIKAKTDQFTFTVSNQVDANALTGGGDDSATIYNYFTASSRQDAFKASGFNTVAPDNASIAAILVDTADLQGNQGQWLTATGFSTFDVTSDLVTTDSASRNASKADVSGLATQASVDVIDGIVDDILVDTSDLQSNQGQWLTATGFSTFNASTDSVTTDTASRDASKADVSSVSSDVTAIKGKTDQMVFTNANELDVNAVTGGGGDDAATIYTYFTASSREDSFKADVSGLLTSSAYSSSLPTNFIDLAIQVTSGKVTTSNPAAGSGSSHTAADVVTAMQAVASDFKADVSTLATQSSVNTIDGIVDDILLDTADLQANQGSWVTATGFSTHSAADVVTAMQAVAGDFKATGFSTFNSTTDTVTTDTASRNASKADVSGVATQSSVDVIDGIVDTILLDTNELQANQGDWATADVSSLLTASSYASSLPANFDDLAIEVTTGKVTTANSGSSHTAADVVTAMQAVSSDFKANVTALATSASVAALNDLSASEVNTQVDTALADIHLDHLLAVDYDPASKPGVATALLNELVQGDGGVSQFTQNALEKGPSGSGSGGGSGGVVGSGSTAHEVTINAGGNPQDGAEVYVTTDSAGTNVVAGTLHTDTQGKATFQLDAATYYLWVQKAGVNFTNPTSFTVS